MSIDMLRAAQAYAQVAEVGANATHTDDIGKAERPNFGAMVTTALSETTGALKAGEAAALDVAAGDASLVDVVTAISAAEASLEAAIAVRNRVIEAYQEIMRMPI